MSRLGVCSWSLQPESAADLARRVREAGLGAVQLALDPLREGRMRQDAVRQALADPAIEILSGMMAMAGEDYTSLESIRRTGGLVPDTTWAANRAAAAGNAALAEALGIRLVTFHAGFIPHDPADPSVAVLVERLRDVVAIFAERGVRVALETGQETAETLLDLLERPGLDSLGVNFDPANMILYGTGDPVVALRALRPHVLQVHVKDALPAARAGIWGTEVPAGEGGVDWGGFFDALRSGGPEVNFLIEREAGDQRVADVRVAAALVRAYGAAA
ncbi:MAG TPA: sugar phosphate isomerase/epimerase family protein [Gemmatimonadales bacterium]|nr:sugar phosphate isomerase/epimerase family protein [Gemmatimonadales bacterium]